MLLPIVSEYNWSDSLRATLYLIALIYCFLGIAIISDIFMGAIEKITSKTKRIYLTKDKGKEDDFIEVPIWSDSVANLTLMAIGSSAPEILLAIIEIISNNFEAGALGASTIVGSAAFNLLCISAVCVMAIPEGEVRRIKDLKVFAVTATFSVVAYIWLMIILVVSSKDVVDLWEAVITLLLFPMLVLIAWMTECNFFVVPDKMKIVID
ncbi:unnamed protein product [Meganyctiphanes norvegica]|uniref:Sodium/calcium exchanger membrane region domain-containing protein n=1 Tax=Meganyctiphanes norvegica TaxID=48144 RepID=A0AAV2RQQ6_MEGNR